MGEQARDPSVAIEEGMNPEQPVVRGRDRDDPAKPTEITTSIGFRKTIEERRKICRRRCDV